MQKLLNIFQKPKYKKIFAKLSVFAFALITVLQLFVPITVHALEPDNVTTPPNVKMVSLSQTRYNAETNYTYTVYVHATLMGYGKFVARSYSDIKERSDGTYYGGEAMIITSDKPFTYGYTETYDDNGQISDNSFDDCEAGSYNGVYYCSFGVSFGGSSTSITSTGFYNERDINGLYDTALHAFQAEIDSGNLSFEKNDMPDYFDGGRAEYDKSIGYLQNVIYKEVASSIVNGSTTRNGVFTWNTSNSSYNDCQIEIKAYNFYTKFWNNSIYEEWTYKQYGDNVHYSDGTLMFSALEPCNEWLSYKGIDAMGSLETQGYGTKTYYLRLVRFSETDNKFYYGGWTKVDISSNSTEQVPITDVETGNFDNITGEWIQDTDSDTSYEYGTDGKGNLTGNIDVNSWDDLNMNSFTWLYRNLKDMVDGLGSFPALVSAVFGFLPPQLITALGMLLVALVVLRFLGR